MVLETTPTTRFQLFGCSKVQSTQIRCPTADACGDKRSAAKSLTIATLLDSCMSSSLSQRPAKRRTPMVCRYSPLTMSISPTN